MRNRSPAACPGLPACLLCALVMPGRRVPRRLVVYLLNPSLQGGQLAALLPVEALIGPSLPVQSASVCACPPACLC